MTQYMNKDANKHNTAYQPFMLVLSFFAMWLDFQINDFSKYMEDK